MKDDYVSNNHLVAAGLLEQLRIKRNKADYDVRVTGGIKARHAQSAIDDASEIIRLLNSEEDDD
jgi:hypothetical protein